MKKIIILFLVVISLNAFAVNEAFFKGVIIANVDSSVISSVKLIDAINDKSQQQIKAQFSKLVTNWKKVEATYLLGDLNEDYLDTPRYIDIFHGNNEDIKSQIDLIISVTDELSYMLYKHSHKTINALEYVLFKHDLSKPRVKKIALIIANSINGYLIEIRDGYLSNQKKFLKSEQYASAILLNTLVSGTYKLKEWRIGDASGLSKKYQDKPNNARAEYAISGNSMNAIRAILATHKQMIDSDEFKDFGDVARKNNANAQINMAVRNLNNSIANAYNMTDVDFTNAKGKSLYASTSKLMHSYYISLMDRLGFVSKILDADGD